MGRSLAGYTAFTLVITGAGPLYAASGALDLRIVDSAAGKPTHARVEVTEGHTVNHGRAAALVDFPGGEFPQIVIGPPGNTWDWSNTTALVLPVENREAEAVGLSIHADEAGRGARAGGSQRRLRPAEQRR